MIDPITLITVLISVAVVIFSLLRLFTIYLAQRKELHMVQDAKVHLVRSDDLTQETDALTIQISLPNRHLENKEKSSFASNLEQVINQAQDGGDIQIKVVNDSDETTPPTTLKEDDK